MNDLLVKTELNNCLIKAQDKLIDTQAKLIRVLESERGEVLSFDEVLRRFQRNLRTLRAKKGMSQERLSEFIDIDNTYISMLERGPEVNPSLKIILRFCTFHKCSFAEIMRK